MEIEYGSSDNAVDVVDNYLQVCLCDNCCDHHMKLSELSERYPQMQVLLHVTENGQIVPLTKPKD